MTQLLLPMLRARADEIGKQLDAMDKGTFPRTVEMIDPSETCVNWESTTPRPKIEACPQNCTYDGCHRPEFTIPSQCNAMWGGGCVHGNIDEKCNGVGNLGQYEGMEKFDGSDEVPYCFSMANFTVKMADCPPPPPNTEEETKKEAVSEPVKKEDNEEETK